MDGSVLWGVDQNGNQRYAKKENGDEYYPMNGEFARDQNGTPQYARTSDGEVIFPLDAKGNESYLKDNGESHVIHVILNEKYAKTALQEAKYPLDEYGNEYTLKIPADIAGKEKDYFPLGYPITNDNFIIIPEVNGKKIISDQLFPNVQVTNITGNFQCPFRNETRHVWTLDNQAQVYTFAHPDGTYRLVFEWEYGVFSKPVKKFDAESLLENLGKYWQVYEYFRSFSSPTYRINETFSRKPVTCVANFQGLKGVFAHKLDGTFGLVYSFPEYIKEKWEGGIHKIHKGISLGDELFFQPKNYPMVR
ncbi:uncharacterized protein TNCT_322791 [Trichonephila clavata]|uniref:WG repeat-containing protein n=1 Tax=Trichonephila clavata TaxID=2740835 RepID=A0A8X6F1I4_TRICU|nr:uncharacterized protein TNCT_322791 [Trichonephila clavata]